MLQILLMLQIYLNLSDFGNNKMEKATRAYVFSSRKNSFRDVVLSRKGPDRDTGHFVTNCCPIPGLSRGSGHPPYREAGVLTVSH